MFTTIIEELRELTRDLDPVLNLFDGYELKPFEEKTPELKFWGMIMNLYYIFKDCDNYQLNIKGSLFSIFDWFSLITEDEYNRCASLWRQVSIFRAWFCHNTCKEFYLTENLYDQIDEIMKVIFISHQPVPSSLLEISEEQWITMDNYLEKEISAYFDILRKALLNIKTNRKKDSIIDKWKLSYSKGLYWNNEMKRNILEDLSILKCLNEQGHYDENVVRIGKDYIENDLKNYGYYYTEILNTLNNTTRTSPTGYTIVKDCIFSYFNQQP